MKKRIRVLQISGGAKTLNGIASYIYQQYRFIDKTKIEYDFLFTRENSFQSVMSDPVFHDAKIHVLEAITGKRSSNDYIRIIRELRKILKENTYDVVVVNSSVVELGVACWIACLGIPNLIFVTHAHNAGLFVKSGVRKGALKHVMQTIDKMCMWVLRRKADYLFACSKDAGAVTFGKKVLLQPNFKVIKNAIDLEKFKPIPSLRDRMRRENHINEQTLVIGSIGSLIPGKNCEFLIHVFSELHKKKSNSILWMIGEGSERERLEQLVSKLGLQYSVIFWGQRTDVHELMQGMDCFVFPSKSEGLGIVAIESQAAGLCTTISDGVPNDVMITELVQKVSLTISPAAWADKILAQKNVYPENIDVTDQIRRAGYDIKEETANLVEFYIAKLKK